MAKIMLADNLLFLGSKPFIWLMFYSVYGQRIKFTGLRVGELASRTMSRSWLFFLMDGIRTGAGEDPSSLSNLSKK
jgi:hypothetical protein